MEATKIKPFPWICPDCRTRTVSPVQRDYTLTADHDGASYELTIANVPVPTCSQCGQAIITSDLSQRVTNELGKAAGLLTPEGIRAKREALGLSHSELARTLRITEATLVRMEAGFQLQPRAVDLLLRLYFDSAEVRQACVSVGAAPMAAVHTNTAT